MSGAIQRKGTVKETNMIGDASPEAKARQMSTELSVASCEYLGESWTFLDCPGSVELAQDGLNAIMVADTAVVVCEADENKALMVAPISFPALPQPNRANLRTYRYRFLLFLLAMLLGVIFQEIGLLVAAVIYLLWGLGRALLWAVRVATDTEPLADADADPGVTP